MDNAVGGCRSALQALEVLEVAFVGVRAGFGEGFDGRFVAGETEDLVAVFEQFLDGGLADEAGGTGDEDAHVCLMVGWFWVWVLEEDVLVFIGTLRFNLLFGCLHGENSI